MKHEKKLRIVRDMLALVNSPVPLVVMREWSGWELAAVEDWAVAVRMKASDNSVRVPPPPACVRSYVLSIGPRGALEKTRAAKAALAEFHAKTGKPARP
jgi:hypothetical protein